MSFRLQSKIPQFSAEMKRKLKDAVSDTALGIESHIKIDMAEEKHGRENRKGHVASAPGESPAIDTGFLVNSIQSEMTGDLSAMVGTNANYAEHLEFGTIHIAPRPFFEPAFEAAKPEFERRLKEAVK
jgi:HK97 gp10 family phage protein